MNVSCVSVNASQSESPGGTARRVEAVAVALLPIRGDSNASYRPRSAPPEVNSLLAVNSTGNLYRRSYSGAATDRRNVQLGVELQNR
jgi:hypothetical protein